MKQGGKSSAGASAFTLIELLVSMTLALLICVLVAEMASGSLRSVSQACGGMTAGEKLDRLRHLLTEDLAAVVADDDEAAAAPSLKAEYGGGKWTLELRLPRRYRWDVEGEAAAWRQVRYRWEAQSGTLWRSEALKPGEAAAERMVAGGLTAFSASWLSSATPSEEGATSWSGLGHPETLRLNVALSGVWEEGQREAVGEGKGSLPASRQYSLLLQVGGN